MCVVCVCVCARMHVYVCKIMDKCEREKERGIRKEAGVGEEVGETERDRQYCVFYSATWHHFNRVNV